MKIDDFTIEQLECIIDDLNEYTIASIYDVVKKYKKIVEQKKSNELLKQWQGLLNNSKYYIDKDSNVITLYKFYKLHSKDKSDYGLTFTYDSIKIYQDGNIRFDSNVTDYVYLYDGLTVIDKEVFNSILNMPIFQYVGLFERLSAGEMIC